MTVSELTSLCWPFSCPTTWTAASCSLPPSPDWIFDCSVFYCGADSPISATLRPNRKASSATTRDPFIWFWGKRPWPAFSARLQILIRVNSPNERGVHINFTLKQRTSPSSPQENTTHLHYSSNGVHEILTWGVPLVTLGRGIFLVGKLKRSRGNEAV